MQILLTHRVFACWQTEEVFSLSQIWGYDSEAMVRVVQDTGRSKELAARSRASRCWILQRMLDTLGGCRNAWHDRAALALLQGAWPVHAVSLPQAGRYATNWQLQWVKLTGRVALEDQLGQRPRSEDLFLVNQDMCDLHVSAVELANHGDGVIPARERFRSTQIHGIQVSENTRSPNSWIQCHSFQVHGL